MASYVRVTPADLTLFHIAARYLGDATQWVRIAELNGVTSPAITYSQQLEIPAVDTTATGGIAAIAEATDGGSE